MGVFFYVGIEPARFAYEPSYIRDLCFCRVCNPASGESSCVQQRSPQPWGDANNPTQASKFTLMGVFFYVGIEPVYNIKILKKAGFFVIFLLKI